MKLNAFQLKIIALFFMVLDSLNTAFPMFFSHWFQATSRFVTPVLAFCMVEGFFHTRSKLGYTFNIFSWAILMEIGRFITNKLLGNKGFYIHDNLLLTLALALLSISFIHIARNIKEKNMFFIVVGVIFAALGSFTQGGLITISLVLIFYTFRGNKTKIITFIVILCALLFFKNYTGGSKNLELLFTAKSSWLAFTCIPFILMYNGKKELTNKPTKDLVYIFYPAHLFLLQILSYIFTVFQGS